MCQQMHNIYIYRKTIQGESCIIARGRTPFWRFFVPYEELSTINISNGHIIGCVFVYTRVYLIMISTVVNL